MADAESPENAKFRLFLKNNEVFVWDKDTILALREKYRIVGSLVGSLPSKPRQNVLYSVPLVLQPEEVSLLVEKKLATVVVSTYPKPTQETVKCFQNERQANIKEQVEKLGEIKKEKLEQFADIIEEGRVKRGRKSSKFKRKLSASNEGDKKKQRRDGDGNDEASSEKRCLIANKLELLKDTSSLEDEVDKVSSASEQSNYKSGLKVTDTSSLDEINKDSIEKMSNDPEPQEAGAKSQENMKEDEVDNASMKNSKNKPGQKEIVLDSTASSEENFNDSTLVYTSTEQPSSLLSTSEATWTFPSDAQETLRFTVFRDLWEKGYYITQASKFGGDYLVYPNDPFRFHSYFIVTVLGWKERTSPLELVAISRLGSTVKKTSVLASVDSSGNVIYTSIQWPGFT